MLPEQVQVLTAMGAPRFSVLVRIEGKTDTHRAWLGFGDFATAPGDDLDPEGATFKGVGQVGNVPALRQLVGAIAERVDLALDGVDDLTVSLADEDADEVRDARVNIGLVFFDDEYQPVDAVAWLWDGIADVPAIDRVDAQRTITLSVGSALTDRTRSRFAFWTPPDQYRRSATDRFCERVPIYDIGSTIKFPG